MSAYLGGGYDSAVKKSVFWDAACNENRRSMDTVLCSQLLELSANLIVLF